MGSNKFLRLIYRNFALDIAPCNFYQEIGDSQSIYGLQADGSPPVDSPLFFDGIVLINILLKRRLC